MLVYSAGFCGQLNSLERILIGLCATVVPVRIMIICIYLCCILFYKTCEQIIVNTLLCLMRHSEEVSLYVLDNTQLHFHEVYRQNSLSA